MREKVIEQKLVDAVKRQGGLAPKFVSPGYDGMPDRLVLMPYGRMGFVEVKAPGKSPRALQKARLKMLKNMGFKVFTLDDVNEIPRIIDEIKRGDA